MIFIIFAFMISKELETSILKTLQEHYHKEYSAGSVSSVSGGSINETVRMKTDEGFFFIKYNNARRYPQMFEKEALGLKLLGGSGTLRVPEVIGTGEADGNAFLVMEYLSSSKKKKNFWEEFGKGLARMHRHTFGKFGLDHDNYMGSLYQSNHYHDHWTDFFREERLEKQLLLAEKGGMANRRLRDAFDNLYGKLGELFPEEPPALVHGDLWSGNYMVDDRGEACLIDPAAYYGHREVDLGMSRLFGVFDPSFYRAYNDEYPLVPGWRERLAICNLYPLMVHVNLFGEGYLGSVYSILTEGGFMD